MLNQPGTGLPPGAASGAFRVVVPHLAVFDYHSGRLLEPNVGIDEVVGRPGQRHSELDFGMGEGDNVPSRYCMTGAAVPFRAPEDPGHIFDGPRKAGRRL